MTLLGLYDSLLRKYGPQGWWPRISLAGREGRDSRGYLPGRYDSPGEEGIFEISVGAVLTQNTTWINAEKAVLSLLSSGYDNPEALLSAPKDSLSRIIRTAGYHNVKAVKLHKLAAFLAALRQDGLPFRKPDRGEVLSVWGIGPETADSILLYAFGQASFVLDAYTRRIVERLGLASPGLDYDSLRSLLEAELPSEIPLLMEFHALIVRHAKEYCGSRPDCKTCFLGKRCVFSKKHTI